MKRIHSLCAAAMLLCAAGTGCKEAAPPEPEAPKKNAQPQGPEDKFQANLAKLDVVDRQLAEAQRFCAVENESRLGSMGTPFKLIVKEQPVFLCCKGCQAAALAHPEKTVAAAEELRKKAEAFAK